MALTLEVNYFNSFYLKRLAGGDSSSGAASSGLNKKLVVPLPVNNKYSYVGNVNTGYPWIAPFTFNTDADWYIEESRIRGGYNNLSVDLGVKAYIVSEEPNQVRKGNSLIYSGIFNSRTGINDTNQFSVAEEITRSVDPKGGTIQKLFAEDTNLTVFQERKVNVALIDKDAIYSAEGAAISTTANVVIGQITPVPGNWGISTNPESFATYGYSKYFVDKDRNAVLKIEGTQLQEIQVAGMTDFFRDQLANVTENDAIVGAWDVYNMNYVVSIQIGGAVNAPARFNTSATFKTITWDERNKGWTSFFTYKPESFFSCRGEFYSTTVTGANSALYLHYRNSNRNTFYGVSSASSVQFIFNPVPNFIKTFKTINYEGSNGWEVTQFVSENTGEDPTVTPSGGWLSHLDSITGGGPIVPTGSGLTLVSSITTQTTDAVDGNYNSAAYITSGSGYGLVINVGVAGNEVSSVTVVERGNGFKVGDTITIPIGLIGGTTAVVITLQSIATGGTQNDVTPYEKIYSYEEGAYLEDGIQYRAGFDRKQNKYYAVVPNNTSTPIAGEVIFGPQTTGIKAYYSTVTIKTDETTNKGGLKSLFAVSSEYINK